MRCDDSEVVLFPRGRGTGNDREISEVLGDGGTTCRNDLRLKEESDGGVNTSSLTGFDLRKVVCGVEGDDFDQGKNPGFLGGTGGGIGEVSIRGGLS